VRVGVKYCGGCNPHYDRAQILARLRRDLPDIEIVLAGEVEVDLVAVICGCPVACASHGDLQGRFGKMVITQEADYETLHRLISTHSAMEDEKDGLEG
jgi:4-hydroxybutyrate CoA-transferase